jgi:ribosomal protein L30
MMHKRLFSSSARSAAEYYKITLKRSSIGLPKDVRAASKTLGLVRLQQTSYKPVNASNAGLILKIKELVQVELVDKIPTKQELDVKKPARGFSVIGNKL